jgi:hypothetical protein
MTSQEVPFRVFGLGSARPTAYGYVVVKDKSTWARYLEAQRQGQVNQVPESLPIDFKTDMAVVIHALQRPNALARPSLG